MTDKIMLTMLAALLLLPVQQAQARNAAQTGVIGGAAGGAIIGQAIGRNTEATLIGTAVGGMLGYIIGNETDKSSGQTVQYDRTVYQYPAPARMRVAEDVCRPTEILATIDGRPEKIYATACLEDGRWMLYDDSGAPVEQTVIIDRQSYYPAPVHVYERNYYGGKRHGRHYRKNLCRPARYDRHYRGRDGVKIIIR